MAPWVHPRPRRAGWRRDDKNRLILIRIPPQLDLSRTPCEPSNPTTASANRTTAILQNITPTPSSSRPRPKHTAIIATLPPEIVHEIISYLPPVDRVCLGLTCKALLLSALSAPRLCPTTWARFSDHRYDWLLPESYSLILRLAHGWIPKEKLRYCWKCHCILPRDEAYFRKRMCRRKNPRFSDKLGIALEEWNELSKKAKYNYLVDVWCHSPAEDSSCLYCDFCRTTSMMRDLESGTSMLRHPVQCPLCLEKELTYVFRQHPKVYMKSIACRCLKYFLMPIEFILTPILIGAEFCINLAGELYQSMWGLLHYRHWVFRCPPIDCVW